VARIRLDPPEICTNLSKGYAPTFLSSSPSLSGRVGVKRFQTAPSIWCGMFLAGSSLLFGIGTWALP
jgi:hypothetical protein